jgi:succinate-semialdehyde dehydrogenase/glutarate-semialdehyde dehydrogenase
MAANLRHQAASSPRSGELLIGGKWIDAHATADVLDKFRLEPWAQVGIADDAQVDAAVAAAAAAFERGGFTPADRQVVLSRAADLVEQRRELLADTIVTETGFTRQDALGEVGRAATTLRLSAEEATRVVGEVVPIQGARGAEGKFAYTVRDPIGVVCAITPFNAPLNTPMHKVAPAIAAGCPVVLKPALYTPITAVRLCEALVDAGLPAGWLNLVNGSGSTVGAQLLRDQRVGFYHFTGSTEVGLTIRNTIGLRQASLELGNISATIVCADADVPSVAKQCVASAYRKAGQVCTSVQLIYVERQRYEAFVEAFAGNVASLKYGDPAQDGVAVGPMIAIKEAERVEAWIAAAVKEGAKCHVGGGREGAVVQPTVLTDVDERSNMVCREVFGPVASVIPVADIEEAIRRVNASPYGLATGLFTSDIAVARRAAAAIRTGTLHVGATSSSRVDLMPFGGVKASGHGKEGPHYAIREMTEERLIVFH